MDKILTVYLRRIVDQLEQAICECDDNMPKFDPNKNHWEKRETGEALILLRSFIKICIMQPWECKVFKLKTGTPWDDKNADPIQDVKDLIRKIDDK